MLCLLHNKTRVAGVENRTRYGLAGTVSSVSGGYSGEVTPDPIPNSEVKLASANGTARVTLWESRTPPDLSWNPPTQVGGFFFYGASTPGSNRREVSSGFSVEGAAGDVEGEALAGEGGEGFLAILLLQPPAPDESASGDVVVDGGGGLLDDLRGDTLLSQALRHHPDNLQR